MWDAVLCSGVTAVAQSFSDAEVEAFRSRELLVRRRVCEGSARMWSSIEHLFLKKLHLGVVAARGP